MPPLSELSSSLQLPLDEPTVFKNSDTTKMEIRQTLDKHLPG